MFDRIVRLSIANPVFVNLLSLLVVAAGILATIRLPREEFPQISLDRVAITTVLPGATAADIEELVTKPIEDALENVADIDEVVSTSQEGSSSVVITFVEGTRLETARSEVEKAVATVDTLPEDTETPVVKEAELEIPVVSVALLGDPGATKLVDELADAFRDIDGVSTVSISGVAQPRIFVDVDERLLLAHGISGNQIAAAIRNANATVPAGSVEQSGQDVFVKTEQRLRSAKDVARIPVRPGSSVRIADVATIKAVSDPADTRVWVDGEPAVKLTIGREKLADPLGIRDDVREAVAALAPTVPPGMTLVMADNYTMAIDDRLDIVINNAVGGAVLVIAILYFLSGFRQALLAVWGMPIAFLVALFLMDRTGLTINVVSTFGLLIAIGIIVDDAIVVIENVQRHMEMGKPRHQAVLDGTREVLAPICVAVFTTCLAFVPLTMVSGTMGRIMQILPLVVIFCLVGSLFEAIFILPGHMNDFARADAHDGRTARLNARMQRAYRPWLGWCVRHPWLTLLCTTAAFVATMAHARTMPFQVNAPAKPTDLNVQFELSPGLDRSATQAKGEQLDALVREHMGDAIASTTLRVGSYLDESRGRLFTGANIGKLRWQFDANDEMLARYPAMVRAIRLQLATDPDLGAHAVQEKRAGPPSGAALRANLRGRDVDEINRAVADVKAAIEDIPGASDLRDDYGAGKETFRVRIDADRAARLGMTERDIANAVRMAIDGQTALELSIDEEQVEIVVRYAGAQGRDKQRLADLVVATPAGALLRLDQVASLTRTREVGFVNREDGMRTVAVEADLDSSVTAPLEAKAALEAAWASGLATRYPDITLDFGGEADELIKSLDDLPGLFGLAILMIYLVLALQFGSYVQPIIILAAVPFGLMGAVLGLAALGYDLSIFAMFGMVALAGIVVNDSLVMIDFINRLRREGLALTEAVTEAALQRLRPILSTTATTVLGLAPMAIGFGGRDEVLAPMAIAIAAGLVVSTTLVLLVVPALYVVVDKLRRTA